MRARRRFSSAKARAAVSVAMVSTPVVRARSSGARQEAYASDCDALRMSFLTLPPAASRASTSSRINVGDRRSARVRPSRARASPDAREDDGVLESSLYALGEKLVGAWPQQAWFRPAQVAVVIGIAGVVDAGYSGDWSRIGVLTREQEDVIKSVVAFIFVAHVAVGALAARVAQERGNDARAAFAQAFACGFLALVDVSYGTKEAKE